MNKTSIRIELTQAMVTDKSVEVYLTDHHLLFKYILY